MIIKSRFKDYELKIVHDGGFIRDLTSEKNTFFVIDRKVYQIYKDTLLDQIDEGKLFLFDAIEQNKNMDTVLAVCERMTELAAKRNIHLVSIGGGITQDITGLVANILYRGIKWTFVPTTLLAACDSCIGGKTSLNYKHFKNLLGTFYPPDNIIINPLMFKSLSENDYFSGLGEVVKFNVLSGPETVKRMSADIDGLLLRDETILESYLESSLKFKKRYIEDDEFDKGIRIQLNYAHTFGHAIETVTGYSVPHGSAVAMGMVIANRISVKRNILDKDFAGSAEELVKRIVPSEYAGYMKDITISDIISAIRKDKKQVDENIRAVLLDDSMALLIVYDVTEEEIKDGFDYLNEVVF